MDNEVIVDLYCGKWVGTFAITASTPLDDSMRLRRIYGCYIPLNIPMIGKNVISLSMTGADSEYFIAGYVTQSGQVYTWGYGWNGSLGHGDWLDRSMPKLVEAFSDISCKQISCGGYHTVVVTESGTRVYEFGNGLDKIQAKVVMEEQQSESTTSISTLVHALETT